MMIFVLCSTLYVGCAVMTFVLHRTFYVHFAGLCCDDKFCCINALLVCVYCRNIYFLLCKPHPLYINGHIYRPATLNCAGKIYNKGYNYKNSSNEPENSLIVVQLNYL